MGKMLIFLQQRAGFAFIVFTVCITLSGCDKESPTVSNEKLCSYVTPTRYSFPNCAQGDLTETNIVYNQDGTRQSWDFTLHCSPSGSTYVGRVYDIVHTYGMLSSYSVEVNGQVCTTKIPIDTADTEAPKVKIMYPDSNRIVAGTVELCAEITERFGVKKVEFFIDNVLVGTGTPGTWGYVLPWNSEKTTTGPHTLFVFATDNSGYVGVSETIPFTVSSWVPLTVDIAIDRPLTGVSFYYDFFNAPIGYAVRSTFMTYYDPFMRSTDSGSTWSNQSSSSQLSFQAVQFFKDSHIGYGIGVGGDGKIYVTDGGEMWSFRTRITYDDLFDVSTGGIQNAITVGENGTILSSTNKGYDWVLRTSGTTNTLRGVQMFNSDIALAVGQNGTILRTTNAGTTWSNQVSGSTKFLYGVCYIDSLNAIAVGELGTILRSHDGGITWSAGVSSNFNWLQVVRWNYGIGIAVGGAGTILCSTDKGNTWKSQYVPTTQELYDAFILSSTRIVVVGEANTILLTKKGGH